MHCSFLAQMCNNIKSLPSHNACCRPLIAQVLADSSRKALPTAQRHHEERRCEHERR